VHHCLLIKYVIGGVTLVLKALFANYKRLKGCQLCAINLDDCVVHYNILRCGTKWMPRGAIFSSR